MKHLPPTLLCASILLSISSVPHAHATSQRSRTVRGKNSTNRKARLGLEEAYRRTHRDMKLYGAAARVAAKIRRQVPNALPLEVTETLELAFCHHGVRLQNIRTDLLSLGDDLAGGKAASSTGSGSGLAGGTEKRIPGCVSSMDMLQQLLPTGPVQLNRGNSKVHRSAGKLRAKTGLEAAVGLRDRAIEECLSHATYGERNLDLIAEGMAAHHIMWAWARMGEDDLESFRAGGFRELTRSLAEGARLLYEVYGQGNLPIAGLVLLEAQKHLEVEANRLAALSKDSPIAGAGHPPPSSLWLTPREGMIGNQSWIGPLELLAPMDLTNSAIPLALPLHGALYWLEKLAASLGPPRFPD